MSLILAALIAGQAGQVAPPGAAAATPLQGLEACRAIGADAARLACYDREAAALVAARGKGDLVLLDRSEVRKTRRQLFGLPIPRLPFFNDDADADEVKRIDTALAAVARSGYDTYRLTMADGTVWETTEGKGSFLPRKGDKIAIERGTLGSYTVSIGRNAVKARRVQ